MQKISSTLGTCKLAGLHSRRLNLHKKKQRYEKKFFCFSSIDGDSHNRHRMQIEKRPQDLTYAVLGYTYLGGAHGSAVDYHVNINKATGKPLTETVDTLKLKELQPILKKGIVSYIAPQDSEVTEKNLKNYLFLGENGLIPIPAHAPYLTPEGVCFKYQQYEIGPYAMGIIEFVVPFKDIKPFLLPEVQKLVK